MRHKIENKSWKNFISQILSFNWIISGFYIVQVQSIQTYCCLIVHIILTMLFIQLGFNLSQQFVSYWYELERVQSDSSIIPRIFQAVFIISIVYSSNTVVIFRQCPHIIEVTISYGTNACNGILCLISYDHNSGRYASHISKTNFKNLVLIY